MVPFQLVVASALAWSGEPNTVLLDFTAVWCGPCQQVSPVISRLERDGVPIRRIDADRNPEVFRQYGVKLMPTFVLLIDGKEVARNKPFTDYTTPEAELRRLCAMLPRPEELPKSNQRQAARSSEAGVDLGNEAPLPQSVPQRVPLPQTSSPSPQQPSEKPGVIDRILGRKKESPTSAPREVRAQGEDSSAVAGASAPTTPLAATVRLRIKDPQGENFGTGTIIDSRPGRTLILTCGHIFRQWGPGSRIQVDLFRGERSTTVAGTKLAFDLENDMGLIGIATDQPLPAARIAPTATKILAGAPVLSVGCSGGDDPTQEAQKIITLNRYKGPDNIECSVVPVQGRSGGGLFDRGGQVIGVCMCADPHHREGLYAGLKTIHAFLDRQQLAHIYRGKSTGDERAQLASSIGAEAGQVEIAVDDSDDPLATGSVDRVAAAATPPAAASGTKQPAISREDVVGSEVVIIIHSNGPPGTPSKVVRLHRASHGFWEHLLPELDPRESLQETTLKRARVEAAKPAIGRQVRKPALPDDRTIADAPVAREASSGDPEPYRRKRATSPRQSTQVQRD